MVARTQINSVAKNIVFITSSNLLSAVHTNIVPQNNTAVIILIIKILVYSAMKIMANKPLLYSVLKPDTSSDSPSAKSNGVRLVSANDVINHIPATGASITIIHDS